MFIQYICWETRLVLVVLLSLFDAFCLGQRTRCLCKMCILKYVPLRTNGNKISKRFPGRCSQTTITQRQVVASCALQLLLVEKMKYSHHKHGNLFAKSDVALNIKQKSTSFEQRKIENVGADVTFVFIKLDPLATHIRPYFCLHLVAPTLKPKKSIRPFPLKYIILKITHLRFL